MNTLRLSGTTLKKGNDSKNKTYLHNEEHLGLYGITCSNQKQSIKTVSYNNKYTDKKKKRPVLCKCE